MPITHLRNQFNLALEANNFGMIANIADLALTELERQPQPVELEAVHVGLTAEQQIRLAGLHLAVASYGAEVDTADVEDLLSVAERFADWIGTRKLPDDPAPAHSTASEGPGSAVEPRTGPGEGDGKPTPFQGHTCPACGQPLTGATNHTLDVSTGGYVEMTVTGVTYEPCGCYLSRTQLDELAAKETA